MARTSVRHLGPPLHRLSVGTLNGDDVRSLEPAHPAPGVSPHSCGPSASRSGPHTYGRSMCAASRVRLGFAVPASPGDSRAAASWVGTRYEVRVCQRVHVPAGGVRPREEVALGAGVGGTIPGIIYFLYSLHPENQFFSSPKVVTKASYVACIRI